MSLDFWRGNPVRELNHLQRNLDRFFDDLTKRGDLTASKSWNPACEVRETDSEYVVRAEIPGIPKEQIKIELDQGVLTISGERKEEKNGADHKTHLSEVVYGSFVRSMSFPVKVDHDKVAASYDHGVLTVTLHKSESQKSRQITIK